MNCSACGEEHHAGERFCGRCGAALAIVATTASTYAPSAPPSNPYQPSVRAVNARQDPPAAPRLTRARRRGPALAAGALVVATLIGISIGRLSSERAGSPETRSSNTPVPGTSTNDVPGQTVSPIDTTTAPSSAELLESARAALPDVMKSLPLTALATDVALVGDRPTFAALAERGTPILIYEFSANDGWEQDSTIGADWGGAEIMPMQMLLVDLTGDGSAEVFVEHIPYNDTMGFVYARHSDGRWTLEVEGRAMTPTSQGNLRGYDEICTPDCAAGLVVEYEYTWTGSAFSYQAFDTRGNEIDLYITTPCIGDYAPRSGPPLRRCDKGPLVETLQAALQWAGFLVSTDGTQPSVDGFYGPSTETSVRLYQFFLGEPVDGIADGPWFYELIENYNLTAGT